MDAINAKPDSAIKESSIIFGDETSAFSLADWKSHLVFRAQMLAKIDVEKICGVLTLYDSSMVPKTESETCTLPGQATFPQALTNVAALAT
ncbi:MAG TPA: hypothetical protein V6C89_21355 [Drouetiella sp.]|jgi:hypothetical protein